MRFGHNFWLGGGGPIDIWSTNLNCILQTLFRDTPLNHIWRAEIRAQIGQIRPSTVFGYLLKLVFVGHLSYKNRWLKWNTKIHVVGVLCCAASDIEIKGQVSHFEMHFRDFSSFSSQCYISARWITSKNYRGESQKKSLTQGWKGRSHPWPLALWGEVKWRGENIHQSMDMIDMWRPTRKEHHKVKI